jgi:hypothetical protein
MIGQYLDSDATSVRYVLPKRKLGRETVCISRNWTALNRFVHDSAIPIDINDCEQLVKNIATGLRTGCLNDCLG